MSLPLHVQARTEARQLRLEALGFTSYAAYLASPAWKAKRQQYVKAGRSIRCMCGESPVQLHHLTYVRVGGDELLDDLEPLCAPCHALVHTLERRGLIQLDLTGFEFDAERARIHRARQHAIEARRRTACDRFHDLPLHERLERLQAAQEHNAGPIYQDLRSIAFMIRKAERKVHGARSGVDAFDARRQARLSDQLDELADRLTLARPDAIEDLTSPI